MVTVGIIGAGRIGKVHTESICNYVRNAHIKTGTLRDVRAIAGYIAGADGQSYIVVSFINNDHAEAARAAHDSLLEWIYAGAH